MIKILYYSRTIDDGGIEKMMLEWIKRLQGKNFLIDLLTEKINSINIKNRFLELGVNLYELPYSHRYLPQKIDLFSKILLENHYDIIHLHVMVSYEVWKLIVAKKAGVKIRIAHSHNVVKSPVRWITRCLHKLCRPLMRWYATDYFACGKEAGLSLFGNKKRIMDRLIIAKNGINLEKFYFDEQVRVKEREKLGIDDNTRLIGSVGRLNIQKNYSFLLNVFYSIRKENKNYKLLIVGSGELEDDLKKQANALGITNDVIFYGLSDNVQSLMCAMDAFMLTSFFEGLVIVLIEAQAMGLPCIVSDRIPKEVNVSGTIDFYSLDLKPQLWANAVINKTKKPVRYHNAEKIIKAGYEIKYSAKKLGEYYRKRVRKERHKNNLCLKGIRIMVMDVDGTLTDGKIYMDNENEICKAFNIKDGLGIHEQLPKMGIIPVIMTGRESLIVKNRCKEIGIVYIYQGVKDKRKKLEEIIQQFKCSYRHVAYIGDDINDWECMQDIKMNGGFVGCPADASKEIKKLADFCAKANGGEGAVREFIEWIIAQ